jgi:DHA2 family multidrug resistance protein-like MFS transporter
MLNQKPDRALLWIVACAFFMQTLDTTIVNTALPSIARNFNETAFAMRPVVVAYSLVMAVLMPASGWLSDRFGTRRVYFTAILLFVLGSLACALANSLDQLVLARVLQGIGGSMLLPVGRLAILRRVTGAQYIASLAFVSVAGQIGPVLGPVMGGLLVEVASWHWIFLINLPIGLVGIYAVSKHLVDDPAEVKPRFDLVGYGLLSFSMLALCLSFDAPVDTHRVAWGVGLFATGLAAVYLYVQHAKRAKNALFELSLFKKANFSVGLVGNLVCRVGSSAVPFLLPLLFQVQMGFTPLHAGLSMLPLAIAGAFSKRWISPLIDYFGFETFLVANTLIVGLSIMSFAAFSPQWPVSVAILQLVIFGSANSMQYAAMNGVTLKGLKGSDASSGNSLFSMVQMVALGLGATAGGGLVGLFSSTLSSTATAFCWTFVCVGLLTFFSAFIFTRLDQSALETPLRKSRRSGSDAPATTT